LVSETLGDDFVSVTLESDTAPPPAAGAGSVAFDGRLL
jgi:hypothetical protein